MAIENLSFIDDFPIQSSMYRWSLTYGRLEFSWWFSPLFESPFIRGFPGTNLLLTAEKKGNVVETPPCCPVWAVDCQAPKFGAPKFGAFHSRSYPLWMDGVSFMENPLFQRILGGSLPTNRKWVKQPWWDHNGILVGAEVVHLFYIWGYNITHLSTIRGMNSPPSRGWGSSDFRKAPWSNHGAFDERFGWCGLRMGLAHFCPKVPVYIHYINIYIYICMYVYVYIYIYIYIGHIPEDVPVQILKDTCKIMHSNPPK